MRALCLALIVLSGGCRRPLPSHPVEASQPMAPAPTATPVAVDVPRDVTLQGELRFCAYGGQGVMAVDANADDFYRVIAVVELPVMMATEPNVLRVTDIVLRGDAGPPLARMRSLIGVTLLPAAPGPLTFATALNPRGTPWNGVVPPQPAMIRIEAWLTGQPTQFAPRAEVTLAGSGVTVRAEGTTAGQWPTG